MSREVGRSWRTIAKHDLMNRMIGQEVGATRYMRGIGRNCWVDLSAGDASPVDGAEWHRACSPGLLAYHASKARQPVVITLHEIQPATYDRLIANLAEHLPAFGYSRNDHNEWSIGSRVQLYAFNGSGHLANVTPIRPGDAAFVLNDPNAITEWAMRDSFSGEIAERTWCARSLSTMGCNPAGIKRLSLSERVEWFSLISTQERSLPEHRDLLIAAIEKDDAQWAYLICTAEKWREKTEDAARKAFEKVGRTVEMAWYRADKDEFENSKQRLFLTRREYQDVVQQPIPGMP